ncbi:MULTISPECIES: Na+/H+ antiporter subunit E [Actinopolyspora]|uniref:Multisubunit sodium/proton antiporter, MrpE subunit n=1 Tax=Actinopolyspora saharensis TaxID=995062 RepID=A0A1H1EF99_9ACTN|nr:Na+/H+ antiporter subunit E [Actinopolyspora saharensis]SDQ87465.1 multisubunit sodium/proton antiporter, MrpE subunit [Actinopolyspora saharensis]
MADHARKRRSPRRRGEHVVSRKHPFGRLVRRIPLLVWLVLVWLLLWGTYDPGTAFFGVLVGVLVIASFPAPPIATDIRMRPLRLVQLLGALAWDLVASTVRVSWHAVVQGPRARAAIVAVTLITDSDHLMAMVANAVSLAPGNFVLQLDRGNRICYVYALGCHADPSARVRGEVLAWERRVVRAVGTAEQVRMVERGYRGEVD